MHGIGHLSGKRELLRIWFSVRQTEKSWSVCPEIFGLRDRVVREFNYFEEYQFDQVTYYVPGTLFYK